MTFLKIGDIGRTYRYVQRYRQILTVLFKYGFGDIVEALRIEQYLEIGLNMVSRSRREKIESLSRAARVRMALEELGPTFIKMGQILATRPDLLPIEFIEEFSTLQDNVPSFPYEDIKITIEKEFKQPLDQIFLKFEEKCIAAASIGQVHMAVMLNGEKVAVKIQRPGIKRIIEVDIEIMMHLAGLMERHLKGMDIQRPSRIVEEFAVTLEKELDFTLEGAYMERFARQFVNEPGVHVPALYRELTTRRVLTMEYISGIKSSDIEVLEKKGYDRCKIASQGLDLIMKQVFVHGFFHADPHPGNIFVLPGNVLCFIDFGMMGRINLRTRERFADLISSIVHRDETKAADALLRLIDSDTPIKDYSLLQKDVAEFMDKHCYRPLKDIDLGDMLHQLLEITTKHQLIIPQDLFLMIKALSTIEGIGRKLDPDLDVIEKAAPFIKRIRLHRINPKRIINDITNSGNDLIQLLQDIPGELHDIFRLLRQGKMKIEFEHQGLDEMYIVHNKISNRIAFAIIVAALIIGSSLIVLSGIPPIWMGIPIIGLLGFLVAGAMGLWLLIFILKSGMM